MGENSFDTITPLQVKKKNPNTDSLEYLPEYSMWILKISVNALKNLPSDI